MDDELRASPLEVVKLPDPRSNREMEWFSTTLAGAFGPGTELRIYIREADAADRRPGTPATWVHVMFEATPQNNPFVPPKPDKPPAVFVGMWPIGCLFWTIYKRPPILRGRIDNFWDRQCFSLVREGRDMLMREYSRSK